jgi:hypothetical protein
MALRDLINQRVERLDKIPAKLLTVIDKQNESVYKAIISDLNTLETKDGQVVSSQANLAKISAIIEKLRTVLFGKEYVEAIKDFAVEIKTQSELNNRILEEVAGTFEDDELYKSAVRKAQENALSLLDNSAIGQQVLKPMSELFTTSIINQTGYLDLVEKVKMNLTGKDALLSKYAGQIVKDTFAVADRQYVQLTARQHGIEFYRWDGGTVEDSRQFCVERAQGVFHYKEIADWGEGKKTDPKFEYPKTVVQRGKSIQGWEGMNYDTNRSTIFSFAGGYQCIHVLIPIATEYVERKWVDRAIRLGFYKEAA